ncbi:hypothetical protein NQ317_000800 [Molorchus minor]|uniref:Transposase n=1 Tax=Molorchus minor TaxID=1323400 RepID=A0ABQ9IX59_9CUCU|nr:hypothetical protein NQ317_000800 [Molorchus minor]
MVWLWLTYLKPKDYTELSFLTVRRLPDLRTFTNCHCHLHEYGKFETVTKNAGRSRDIRNPVTKEQILNLIDENPRLGTRQISNNLGVSQSTMWRVLYEFRLYPYHVQHVQGLPSQEFT